MYKGYYGFILIIIIAFICIPSSFAMDNNLADFKHVNTDISDDILIESNNEIHVDINGDDDGDGSLEQPFASINKAIEMSSNNSKIIIHDGIYKENNLNITKSLQICSQGNVVIDGENSSRIFTINTKPSDEVLLSGITFINGRAYQGGAIFVRNAITTIDNSKFINNTAITEGGAIYWNSDYGKLTNCIVEGNCARDGAGVSWGGIDSTFTGGDYGQIINTTFVNNHLTQDGDACIGLSIYSERSKIINSKFKNHNVVYNSSFEVLYINGDYSEVSGCLFENNAMTMTGALGLDGNFAVAYNNIFINNTVSFNDSFGGAIGIQSENANIYNNTFISNGGKNAVGGAIFINTIETFSFNFINITDNVFRDNIAYNGAGIYTTGKSNMLTLVIRNNSFNGDNAIKGAGIYLVDIYNPVSVKNNSFKDLISEMGPSIYSNHCTLQLSNNFMENTDSINGESIYTDGEINSKVYLRFNNVSGIYGQTTVLTANMKDDMNNSILSNAIEFSIDGKSLAGKKGLNNFSTIINEIGEFKISGSYNAAEVVVEDGFLNIMYGAYLKILKNEYYGKNVNIDMNLTGDDNKSLINEQIILNLNGNDYLLVTDDNGIGHINLDLDYKKYNVFARFAKNGYFPVNISEEITVSPSIQVYDMTRAFKSGHDFSATFLDEDGNPLANADVLFNVNSNEYSVKTDLNGVAKLYENLNVGSYLVSVINPVTNDKISKNLNIVKRITGNKNINMYFGAGSTYKIRVFDDDGKIAKANEIVLIKINGKQNKVKTDSNGYVTFKINLPPKTYTITAEYKGVKVSNKVVVKPVLTAKNISKKKAKTIKFQAKLVNTKGKIVKGKKITFKVKGKTYTAKTNSKGIATVSLKNLKVGKYTITTKYEKSTIKNTIKIKK